MSPLQLSAAVAMAAVAPLLFIPSLRQLSHLSWLGFVSTLVVMFSVCAAAAADPHRTAAPLQVRSDCNLQCCHEGCYTIRGRSVIVTTSAKVCLLSALQPAPGHHLLQWGIVPAFGIFAVSVSGHSSLPAIRASMAKPHDFGRVLNLAFVAMAVIYSATAGFGWVSCTFALRHAVNLINMARYVRQPASRTVGLHPGVIALQVLVLWRQDICHHYARLVAQGTVCWPLLCDIRPHSCAHRGCVCGRQRIHDLSAVSRCAAGAQMLVPSLSLVQKPYMCAS
jgi:Transmembrane amino acid transporter protein